MKRSSKLILIWTLGTAVLLYAVIFALQKSDEPTIDTAREAEAFINSHCKATKRVPSIVGLLAQFPSVTKKNGWFVFSDARTYLKLQYPVKWWSGNAIGNVVLSEYTRTPKAYVAEFRCGPSK